jgi:hypothetical protein
MEEDGHWFSQEESVERQQVSGMTDIQETLHRVDEILAEFYEIHRPHIKDQGDQL